MIPPGCKSRSFLFVVVAALASLLIPVRAAAQAPFVWTGAGFSNSLSDASNWAGHVAPPNDGSALLSFGPALSTVISLDSVHVAGLSFVGNTRPYFLFGNYESLAIGAQGIVYTPGTIPGVNGIRSTISDDIHLSADQTWNITSGTLAIEGTLNSFAEESFDLTKTGGGTLSLRGDSGDWAGNLNLLEGRLVVTPGFYEYYGFASLGYGTLVFGAPTSDPQLTPTLVVQSQYDDDEVIFTSPIVANGILATHNAVELMLAGSVTLNGNTTLVTTGRPLYIAGGIGESAPGARLTLNSKGVAIIGQESENANTYTGGTQVDSGILIFDGLDSIPAVGQLTATPNGYIGLAGGSAEAAAFLSQFDKGATTGTIGFDSEPDSGATEYTEAIDLTGFGIEARLGSATQAILSGTITPQGTDYRFGGGGGMLEVVSNLSGVRGLIVDSPDLAPLTLYLGNAENSFTGGVSVTNSAVVFETIGSLPAGTNNFTLSRGAYVGIADPEVSIGDFLGHFPSDTAGIIGFDSLAGPRTITDLIDLSRFTNGAYLGSASTFDEYYSTFAPGVRIENLLPSTDDIYRFAGYKGGGIEIAASLATGSVTVGNSDVAATFGDLFRGIYSSVALTGDNAYEGGTQFYAGRLLVGQSNGEVGTNATSALGGASSVLNVHRANVDLRDPDGHRIAPRLESLADGLIIGNDVVLHQNVQLDLGGEYDFSILGNISGQGSLYIGDDSRGGFTLTLGGNNTFGSAASKEGLYISAGSNVVLTSNTATGNGPLSFGYSGGTATFTGLAANPVIHGLFSNTFAQITLDAINPVLTVDQLTDSSFQGTIDTTDPLGAGRLVKTGPGSLRLDSGVLDFDTGVIGDGISVAQAPDLAPVTVEVKQGALVVGSGFSFTSTDSTLLVQGNTNPSLAGKLVLDGAVLDNRVTLNGPNARLAGSGLIGSTTVGGGAILSPGTLQQPLGGLLLDELTLAPGGILEWNVTGRDPASADFVAILNPGMFSITATESDPFTIKLIGLTPSGAPGLLTGFTADQSYTWSLFVSSGIDPLNNFDIAKFRLDTTNFQTDLAHAQIFLVQNGDDLELHMIPEPSTYALLGIGGLVLLARLRRRAGR